MSRILPQRRNPLIEAEIAPNHDELLSRRRLGRTRLSVKPEQLGTTNATKSENLGPVEYAHLRAPLPDDLTGSEIFAPQAGQPHPQTYFLMRRSKDGYVSATGMFKIAFPWASHAEEKAERDYLKNLDHTSSDEVAGNIWVTPDYSLELADEYGLTHWMTALLDPADIESSPTSAKKNIAEPPKFDLPSTLKHVSLSPPPAATTKRARGARVSSPSKAGTPASQRVKASPRKRQTKKEKEANIAHANAASASLQSALDDALSVAEATPAPESVTNDDVTASVDGEVSVEPEAGVEDVSPEVSAEPEEEQKVRVEVDQEVEVNGDTEVTHTNVTVEMPAGLPELPPPEDMAAALQKAKEMVEAARAGETSSRSTRKRKIESVEPSDVDAELPVQPAKRAKVLEEKYKRERVRTRAIFTIAASLAVTAAIPFFTSLLS